MKLFASLVILFLVSCSSSKMTVKRVDVGETKDLSGYWNDTDSRLVSEEMIKQLSGAYWLNEFISDKNRKPTVIVGRIRNRTSEHINTKTFIKDLEKDLINSGQVSFVANRLERSEVRSEKEDQQSNASMETAKALGNEKGADFMLLGEISSIVDQVEGERVTYYQINLELVQIETNEKVWIGDKKIKKVIQRDSHKF